MSRNIHPGFISDEILRAFLLSFLYKIFFVTFLIEKPEAQNHNSMEYHFMDSKVIQFLIQNILDTEEYTLEGIAYYTHIPFDVIYDIACGVNKQASITTWTKLLDLYLRVKPDMLTMLVNRLLEIHDKNKETFLSILTKYH